MRDRRKAPRSAQQGFTSVTRSAQQGFTSVTRSAQQGFTSVTRSAQKGFTSVTRSAQQGFTLIELMVVIVIIGLMSATVVLTMADPRGRMGDDADRFSGRVRAARDSAILNAEPTALWVSQTGYGFDRRRRGRWEPVTEGPLASQDWSRGISAKAGQSGQARVIFDTVGRADQPLAFAIDRDERKLTIRMDLDGKVTTGE